MYKLQNDQIEKLQCDFKTQIENGSGGLLNPFVDKMLVMKFAYDDIIYALSYVTYNRIDTAYENGRNSVNIGLDVIISESEKLLLLEICE